MIHNSILELIGHTPIVRLNKISQGLPFDLHCKVEYFNPGASVKDRIAIHIINEAEKKGLLKPGGTIVEATSGNTGMGLALVAAVRGYKAVFVMPDKMSNEKISALRAFGAKVVVTPTDVEPEDPRSYYCVSRRIADETPNAFYANQYHNPDNPQAHYLSTGPEIWEQTEGKVTALICGLGTGGTITGTARYLRERNPNLKVIGIDPEGSIYTELFKTGKMGHAHPYKVEGVGEDFVPSTIDLKVLNEIVQVSDQESFSMTRALARREGLFVGGSCGFAVAGAVKWAKAQKTKEFPVIILPDSGSRYLSKIFNDDWMRENGFLEEPEIFVSDVFKAPSHLHSTTSESTAFECIEMLRKFSISQLPVLKKDGALEGIITESDLLTAISKDPERGNRTIKDLVVREVETVDLTTPVRQVQEFLRQDYVPIVVDHGRILGVLTKIDLLEYFVRKGKVA